MSSSIKQLDPGVHPRGVGRGCKAAKAATATLRRGDDLFYARFDGQGCFCKPLPNKGFSWNAQHCATHSLRDIAQCGAKAPSEQAVPSVPLGPVIHQCLDDLPFALGAVLG